MSTPRLGQQFATRSKHPDEMGRIVKVLRENRTSATRSFIVETIAYPTRPDLIGRKTNVSANTLASSYRPFPTPDEPPTEAPHMKIWKQELAVTEGHDTITVYHQGILHVGLDPAGAPCVWFFAPEAEPPASRVSHVTVVGTGIPFDQPGHRYIGTFNWKTLVLHAFEQPGSH